MDELIQQLRQKTGLGEPQAKQAADFVINFIKGKLPAPIAAQIDGVLKGGATDTPGILGKLGGVLANK